MWSFYSARVLVERVRNAYSNTEAKYFEKYVDIIDLARRAGEIYQKRSPEEKRMLLKSIFTNLVIKDKKVAYTLNKPMEIVLRRVQEKIDAEKLFEPRKSLTHTGQKGVSTPLHPSLLRW